jgi:hypothetical protein
MTPIHAPVDESSCVAVQMLQIQGSLDQVGTMVIGTTSAASASPMTISAT